MLAARIYSRARARLQKAPKLAAGGFTIVELTLSVTIVGILSVGILGVSTYYFSIITRNNILVDMSVDSQNLLRATVEELRYGAGVRNSNTISDPNGPSGGWNTSNSNFVIIIAVPALDASGEYIINTTTGAPYNNEYVYFKSGTELHKRTLAHPSATGNTATTSCPESLASSTCPPDKKLIQHAKDMVFTLYDQDDVATTDPLAARSVVIDLSLERDTFGDPLVLHNSIRATLRNKFQ